MSVVSRRGLFKATGLLALIASLIFYRTLTHEQAKQALIPESEVAEQPVDSPDDTRSPDAVVIESQPDLSPATTDSIELHQDLIAMSEASRNHILWRILSDAGFHCDEVRNSQLLGADAWRAECGAASAYGIVIGEFNDISINPIYYGDFRP